MNPQQFRQAVLTCAAEMDSPEDQGRLQKAIDLVLGGNVALDDDGNATVQSGNKAYTIDLDDGCSCTDAQMHTTPCKHALAVNLYVRVQKHLQNGMELPDQPVVSRAAGWAVEEAPASCCLKLQLGLIEMMYTMRDCDDDTLFARIRRVLPKLMEMVGSEAPSSQIDAQHCPIHQVPMKRHSKNGESLFSHQAPDGQWCRGR